MAIPSEKKKSQASQPVIRPEAKEKVGMENPSHFSHFPIILYKKLNWKSRE
jgi:hypothetical protein